MGQNPIQHPPGTPPARHLPFSLMPSKRQPPDSNKKRKLSNCDIALHGLQSILPSGWKSTVGSWLVEDTPDFDYGGFVVGNGTATATLFCKTDGAVMAGFPFFTEVFKQVGCDVRFDFAE